MTRRSVWWLIGFLAVMGVGTLLAALTLGRSAAPGAGATTLVFEVPYQLDEGDVPPSSYTLDWLRPERPTLWRTVAAIRRAAEDRHVEALVMHIDGIDWGWAKVAEVREAIQAFRAAGKPVYASLSGGGEREYLLASAATYVASPPLAMLQIDGLTGSAVFLRGTLDKLDIRPNFAHAGAYKSGVEGYTRTGMSAESRVALQELVDDLYRTLVDSLAAARGVPADSMALRLDQGPYEAERALAAGLIDTLLYREDLDSLAMAGDEGPRRRVRFGHYMDSDTQPSADSRFALVVASGTMVDGRSQQAPGEGEMLGSETVIKALREARERSSIKAVILRIDSPGGAATAADAMWREVERTREQKPVVASMSDYAASGGYFIAMGADTVVAHPASITGSIGVYGGKLNILGLLNKLGLNVETVSRGEHAEMLSPYRDFTAEETGRFQEGMEVVYRTFKARVAHGRGMTMEEVERHAQGRVWSGSAAFERGLVDELGGLSRAVAMARHLAGIPEDETVALDLYPRSERTFLQRFFSRFFEEGEEEAFLSWSVPVALRSWLAVARLPQGAALAILPFTLEIR